MGLFDTVCAVGTVSNLFDVHSGVNPGVELNLPPGIAQKVFQITAMHECRYNFSLNSIKEAWPELALPGVHSDIGGGYNPKEKEYLFLTHPQNETVSESIPSEVTDIYRRSAAEIPDLKSLPALSAILPSGEVKAETWYDYLVNENKKSGGITQKRVGAAVTIERVVKNDWSKVSLRVMIDAAQEAGGIFEAYDHLSPDMKLPPELEPLCQKAIDQGKTVRGGGVPTPFISPELQLIGKYIHCSAHWNPVVVKEVWLDGDKVKTIYGAVKSSDLLCFINRPNPGWIRAVWNMQGGKS
ncbi:putative type VI secretion protein [Escherichia coli]|nr:putative type VI secretion protein [Escherichia coli]